MPTLAEINAKRKELGVSALDAKKALQPNTPIAGVPPQPTYIPPPTIQPEAKAGDVVVGVGGERFIQANNKDLTTNVTGQGQVVNQSGQDLTKLQQVQAESFGCREGANIAPIAPREAPVNNTVPGVTPNVPNSPTTSETSSSPSVKPSNLMDFMKGKDEYGPDGRKVIGYRASHSGGDIGISTADRIPVYEGDQYTPPQDSGTIFNTLKLGGSVPTSDTPEYKQAQARYNTFKRFSTYDVASLSTAMQDGSLLMGTQAYNDVISDPAMLAKVQRARAFTSGNVDLNVIGEKSGQYVMTSNPTVAKALEDGNMSQEEYDSLTNNPDVEAQAKVVSEARAKYDEYKRQLENISDTVDEEYKTDNEIFKNAVKSNLDKSIRRLYNSASDDLQNALGTYTELKNSSTALLEINMKQYEQKKAQEAQLAQEARQQQYGRENAMFQAGLAQENALFQNTLQQSNASFQTIGDKVYKVQNGQMTDTGIKAEPNTTYQAVGGKLYKIKGDSITDTGISAITPETPKTPEWRQDASGNWYNANSSTNPGTQTAGTPAGLLDYISASEGTHGNYNAMYGKGGQNDINLTGMTIKEIQDLQRKSIYKDKNGNYVGGAMGKYQIVSGTLQGLINRGVVKPTDMFDQETQDKMAMSLLGNSYADYQAGKITADQLQNKVSGIWAGVPNTKGVSTYASDGTNKAKADNGAFLQAIGGTKSAGSEDIKMQALSLVQGLGGTADERKAFADNVIKVSQRDNISLAEAKKKLGYKSADDTEFAKARGAEFKTIKSDTRDKLSNANTALTLLNSPQTAIGDVASVVGFLKTIDPASVARESEVAAVENARGVIDSLSNVFAKAKEGTKLTDSQRKQLKDSIQTIVNAGNAKYNQYITETVQEFNDRGLDPTVYISKSEIERTKASTTNAPIFDKEALKARIKAKFQ